MLAFDFAALLTTENAIALLTLTLMEIVLGIDNIVFISVLTDRLPEGDQPKARRTGLMLAMVMRILLLLGISWIASAKAELFNVLGHPISARDLIMLAGGLFLIAKATKEIHKKIEEPDEMEQLKKTRGTMSAVLIQIILIDLVFSLDSVITAVGMAKSIIVMVLAVAISIGVMLAAAESISGFVNRNPTVKMLALSFLILIGVMLVADGLGQHIPKGYIYFAMAFSLGVEMLNMRVRKVTSQSTKG